MADASRRYLCDSVRILLVDERDLDAGIGIADSAASLDDLSIRGALVRDSILCWIPIWCADVSF